LQIRVSYTPIKRAQGRLIVPLHKQDFDYQSQDEVLGLRCEYSDVR
jgi:hypothetical protein